MNDSPETRLSLIGRLRDSEDGEAWSEFVQIYEPLVRAIAVKRGLQHADAGEVTQEVLTRVARSVAQFSPDRTKGTFRGWLYRVTQNLTIDHLRVRKRLPPIDDNVDLDAIANPGDDHSRQFRLEYERQLFNWAAARVQDSTKPENWQAFWQSAIEGKPIDDVAKQLGIPKRAVYLARSRVMSRMTALIQKRLEETSCS